MAKTLSVLLLTNRDARRPKVPPYLLPFGEDTILQKTLEAYQALDPTEIVVATPEPAFRVRDALDASLREKVLVVSSPDFRARVGQAIRLGLERLVPEPEVLALGWTDQPLLTPDLLRRLHREYTQGSGRIGVPVCQGIPGHPVFFPRNLLGELLQLGPEETHRHVLLRHPEDVVELEAEETAVLRTVEDPESYREMLAMAGLPFPEDVPVVRPGEEAQETEAAEQAESPAEA
jgi:molybdenum cofactor cytidylyltransferase